MKKYILILLLAFSLGGNAQYNLFARQNFAYKVVSNGTNTEIGGVASSIGTPTLLAAKLGILESRITNFSIVGSDIKCKITGSYSIPSNAFQNNTAITYYKDISGLVTTINTYSFGIITDNFKEAYFPNATSVSNNGFSCANSQFPNIDIIYLPRCTVLGSSQASSNGIFGETYRAYIRKLYVDVSLSTCNAGSPDPDLTTYTSLTGNVVYVTNFTPPSQISDLSSGTIDNTAIQLNFTAPSSANAIDYYEVYINGVYNNKISGSGGYANGLISSTSYNITLKAVDIFYNKSFLSNSIVQTTASSPINIIPTSNIVAYYKLENNSLDSSGSNNGTATDISYSEGLVQKAANFNATTSKIVATNVSATTSMSITILLKNNLHNNVEDAKSGLLFMNTENFNSHYPNVGDNNIYISLLTNSRKTIGTGVISDRTQWHTITVTANTSSNVWKFYQNGTLVHTGTVGTLSLLTNFTLGKSKDNYWYNGRMDEFAVFNKELSLSEINEISSRLLTGQHLN